MFMIAQYLSNVKALCVLLVFLHAACQHGSLVQADTARTKFTLVFGQNNPADGQVITNQNVVHEDVNQVHKNNEASSHNPSSYNSSPRFMGWFENEEEKEQEKEKEKNKQQPHYIVIANNNRLFSHRHKVHEPPPQIPPKRIIQPIIVKQPNHHHYQSMQHHVQQPMYQAIQQPTYQTIKQPTYQTMQQPIYQTVQQPLYPTMQQPMYQTMQQPMYQPVQKPVYQPVYQPMHEPLHEPVYEPIHEMPIVTVTETMDAYMNTHTVTVAQMLSGNPTMMDQPIQMMRYGHQQIPNQKGMPIMSASPLVYGPHSINQQTVYMPSNPVPGHINNIGHQHYLRAPQHHVMKGGQHPYGMAQVQPSMQNNYHHHYVQTSTVYVKPTITQIVSENSSTQEKDKKNKDKIEEQDREPLKELSDTFQSVQKGFEYIGKDIRKRFESLTSQFSTDGYGDETAEQKPEPYHVLTIPAATTSIQYTVITQSGGGMKKGYAKNFEDKYKSKKDNNNGQYSIININIPEYDYEYYDSYK